MTKSYPPTKGRVFVSARCLEIALKNKLQADSFWSEDFFPFILISATEL